MDLKRTWTGWSCLLDPGVVALKRLVVPGQRRRSRRFSNIKDNVDIDGFRGFIYTDQGIDTQDQ